LNVELTDFGKLGKGVGGELVRGGLGLGKFWVCEEVGRWGNVGFEGVGEFE